MSSTDSKRHYDGTGRQRDAAQRRTRMLDAARELFLEIGYGATSIELIAQRAGTSPQTVYAAFGNKPGVLRRVIDVAVAGDDQDVKLMERPEMANIFDMPLEEMLGATARLGAESHERGAELLCLVDSVAGAEPALRELAGDLRRQMRIDAERFIESIPADRLRTDLDRDHLVDIVSILGSPGGWHTLVVERGWAQAEYVDWFADALARNLLVAS